jgi:hypothetical protein
MGFYERWIVPRLLDLAMRNRLLDHYRQQTIVSARGLVLEVGVGSGVNLSLYGRAVTRVIALDLSPNCCGSRVDARLVWSLQCRCSEPLRNTCRLLMRYSIQS